jgi:hypothetical protein
MVYWEYSSREQAVLPMQELNKMHPGNPVMMFVRKSKQVKT